MRWVLFFSKPRDFGDESNRDRNDLWAEVLPY